MNSLNKVLFIGNVGNTPEVKHFPNGMIVAKFNLATNEYYMDKNNQKQERVYWHKIVAFNGLADFVEKTIEKGDRIYVEGKLVTNSYIDSKNEKKYNTEIHSIQIIRLSKPKGYEDSKKNESENDYYDSDLGF